MATLFDDASLVMIPSGYKDDKLYSIKPTDGSGDFTFSRDGSGASPATRVNSAGLIEKGRTNLLLQSNQFDTTWTNTSSTETSGQSGYDGTNNAWKIDITATYGQIIQSVSVSGVSCASIYVKAGTLGFVRLRFDASPNAIADFDLSDGSAAYTSGIIDASSESIGNGWYRISMVSNVTSSTFRIYPLIAANDLTGSSGNIYIQNAQLEKGLVSTSYIETTTAAASAGILGDMPRLDYSGGASCPNLLLEPARTNLITQSEYFGDSSWSKTSASTGSNAIVTDNYGTSPEGLNNASRLQLDLNGGATVSDISYIADYYTATGAATTNTIYMKSLSGTANVRIRCGSTFKSVDVTTDWQRFDVTDSSTSDRFQVLIYGGINSDTADLLIWGAQAETGSYPTSYVPTYGSATARAADGHLQLTDLINKGIGTSGGYSVLFELDQNENPSGSNSGVLFIGKDANMSSIELSVTSYEASESGRMRIVSATDGTVEYLDSPNTRKYAFSVNGTSVIWADENESGTDTISVSGNSIGSIKAQYGTSERTISFWKQLILIPEVLTAQELQKWCS